VFITISKFVEKRNRINFRNFFNFKNIFLKNSPISPGFEGNGDESDENEWLFFAHLPIGGGAGGGGGQGMSVPQKRSAISSQPSAKGDFAPLRTWWAKDRAREAEGVMGAMVETTAWPVFADV
jgi:hypothetical protein